MSYSVVFAPEARDQLEALFLYIAERSSLVIAEHYTDAVVATWKGAWHCSPSVVWHVKTSALAFGSPTTKGAP
jgi:hypothetical protein